MSESITYYGFRYNHEFLKEAPVGTQFHFNTENGRWVKVNDGVRNDHPAFGWVSHDNSLYLGQRTWPEGLWAIHVDVWGGDGGRTPEQNARIVAKLEELMEIAVDNVKNGDAPSETDVLWMSMILDCIEEGEKG